jgi:hypothetical protein
VLVYVPADTIGLGIAYAKYWPILVPADCGKLGKAMGTEKKQGKSRKERKKKEGP